MLMIWKYPLAFTNTQVLDVPKDYQVLDVQIQASSICLWLLVDPAASKVKIQVSIYATGNRIEVADNDVGWYAGTIQDGPLEWHVFLRDLS